MKKKKRRESLFFPSSGEARVRIDISSTPIIIHLDDQDAHFESDNIQARSVITMKRARELEGEGSDDDEQGNRDGTFRQEMRAVNRLATPSRVQTKKERWIDTGLLSDTVMMEVEVDQCRVVAETGLSEGKARFVDENSALVRIIEENLVLIVHSDVDVRGEAIHFISSHLDLTRSQELRMEIKNALECQLWKEDDHSVIQKLVKLLSSLVLLQSLTSPPHPPSKPTSNGYMVCTCGNRNKGSQTICDSCAKAVDLHTSDGLVSSSTSPQKSQPFTHVYTGYSGLDMHSKEDSPHHAYKIDGVGLAQSVAGLLHGYLARKDLIGSRVKSAVRLQILHSLLKIGERTEGVVTWESLGFVIRRQLRSSNPRVRAMVLRLLAESINDRRAFKTRDGNGTCIKIKEEDKEVESCDAKRRRIGDLNTVAPSAKIERDQEVLTDAAPGNFSSLLEVGEMFQSTVLEYMKDPYPIVREAAAKALMKLHAKGYDITSECYKNATSLFQDCFEPVRIAAIQMVGIWMRGLPKVKDSRRFPTSKELNEPFLQVCTKVTDMNMRVREEAFRVLGEAMRIGESVLLQTLTKKVTGTVTKEDVPASVSITTPEDDTDLLKFGEGLNLLDASAAGVFVHGLEDEFFEVRCMAIGAMAKLACECRNMVPGAVDLLLDMLNDEVEAVRKQTMHALSQLAMGGHLSVLDRHLHMFLSVLEDKNVEMRMCGCNLLALLQLPSFGIFHAIIRSLLTSLEHHPEDAEGVNCSLSILGQGHPTYTECIAHELLQEVQGSLNGEAGLDEPRCAAIMSLFLGAGPSNPTIITLIPAKFLSYASLVSHKLPKRLPLIKIRPVGLKSVQFSWWQREHGNWSTELNDHLTPETRKVQQLNALANKIPNSLTCPAHNSSHGEHPSPAGGRLLPDTEGQWSQKLSFLLMAEDCVRAKGLGTTEILDFVNHTTQTAHSVHMFLDRNAFRKALLILSGCRRDLKMLQGRNHHLRAVVRYSAFYIGCLNLIVQIQAQMSQTKLQMKHMQISTIEKLCQKLDHVLKHSVTCFSNMTSHQLVQLLDLHILAGVLNVASLPEENTNIDGPVVTSLMRLRRIVADKYLVTKNGKVPSAQLSPSKPISEVAGRFSLEEDTLAISPFSKLVQLKLLNGNDEDSTMRKAQGLVLSYWPTSCFVNEAIKETWAEIKGAGSDFEHPLGFVPCLPFGISLDILVYDAPEGGNFWVQYRLVNLPPRYRYLDLLEASECGRELRWHDFVLQVDDMPPVAACSVKICVVLESCLQEEEARSNRGPKQAVVPLCVDIEAHVVLNKEKVTKSSQLRRN